MGRPWPRRRVHWWLLAVVLVVVVDGLVTWWWCLSTALAVSVFSASFTALSAIAAAVATGQARDIGEQSVVTAQRATESLSRILLPTRFMLHVGGQVDRGTLSFTDADGAKRLVVESLSVVTSESGVRELPRDPSEPAGNTFVVREWREPSTTDPRARSEELEALMSAALAVLQEVRIVFSDERGLARWQLRVPGPVDGDRDIQFDPEKITPL